LSALRAYALIAVFLIAFAAAIAWDALCVAWCVVAHRAWHARSEDRSGRRQGLCTLCGRELS
jgi:hypothetical protein